MRLKSYENDKKQAMLRMWKRGPRAPVKIPIYKLSEAEEGKYDGVDLSRRFRSFRVPFSADQRAFEL